MPGDFTALLPAELLVEILDNLQQPDVLCLGQVSRRWRDVALSHARYYAYFRIVCGMDAIDSLCSLLAFGRDMDDAVSRNIRIVCSILIVPQQSIALRLGPLLLESTAPPYDLANRELKRALVNALGHVIRLSLHAPSDVIEALSCPAPLLEHLELGFTDDRCRIPWAFLHSHAPRLTHVRLRGVELAPNGSRAFEGVTRLYLESYKISILVDVPVNFPNLVHLECEHPVQWRFPVSAESSIFSHLQTLHLVTRTIEETEMQRLLGLLAACKLPNIVFDVSDQLDVAYVLFAVHDVPPPLHARIHPEASIRFSSKECAPERTIICSPFRLATALSAVSHALARLQLSSGQVQLLARFGNPFPLLKTLAVECDAAARPVTASPHRPFSHLASAKPQLSACRWPSLLTLVLTDSTTTVQASAQEIVGLSRVLSIHGLGHVALRTIGVRIPPGDVDRLACLFRSVQCSP